MPLIDQSPPGSGKASSAESKLSPKRRAELLEQFLDDSEYEIPGDKANILKDALQADSKKWSADSVNKFAKTAAKKMVKKNLFDAFGFSFSARVVNLPFTVGMKMLEDSASYRTVAMRSVAYRVTAWAYQPNKRNLPRPSKFVEEVASLPFEFRGKQAALAEATKAWNDASTEAVFKLEQTVQNDFDYDQQNARESLVILGG